MKYEQSKRKIQTIWYNQENLRVDSDRELSKLVDIENNSLQIKSPILFYKKSLALSSDWMVLTNHSSSKRTLDVYASYASSYYITLDAFVLDWLPFIQIRVLIKGLTTTNLQEDYMMGGTYIPYFYHIYETEKPVITGNVAADTELRKKIKKVLIGVHYYIESSYAFTDAIKPVYWKILFQFCNPHTYGG